jgi:hypothetical protein
MGLGDAWEYAQLFNPSLEMLEDYNNSDIYMRPTSRAPKLLNQPTVSEFALRLKPHVIAKG